MERSPRVVAEVANGIVEVQWDVSSFGDGQKVVSTRRKLALGIKPKIGFHLDGELLAHWRQIHR